MTMDDEQSGDGVHRETDRHTEIRRRPECSADPFPTPLMLEDSGT